MNLIEIYNKSKLNLERIKRDNIINIIIIDYNEVNINIIKDNYRIKILSKSLEDNLKIKIKFQNINKFEIISYKDNNIDNVIDSIIKDIPNNEFIYINNDKIVSNIELNYDNYRIINNSILIKKSLFKYLGSCKDLISRAIDIKKKDVFINPIYGAISTFMYSSYNEVTIILDINKDDELNISNIYSDLVLIYSTIDRKISFPKYVYKKYENESKITDNIYEDLYYINSNSFILIKNNRRYYFNDKNLFINKLTINEDSIDDLYNILYEDGVSIILPAYNVAEYIEECLDSIYTQSWFKTHDNWEVLVGIDCCYKTLSVIKSIMGMYKNLRVYWSNINIGPYLIKNSLILKSKYDIIQTVDGDDIVFPNFIESNLKKVTSSNYVVSCGDMFKDSSSNIVIKSNNFTGYKMMYKSIFFKYNGYMGFKMSGDEDFVNRMRDKIECCNNDEKTIMVRYLDNSLTHSKDYGINTIKRKRLQSIIYKYKKSPKKYRHMPLSEIVEYKKTYIFINVAVMCVENSLTAQEVLDNILKKIDDSSLYDYVDKIFIIVNGDISKISIRKREKYVISNPNDDVKKCEFPTLDYLWDVCQKENCDVLYLHTKGVARNLVVYQGVEDWNNYMLYYNVEQWRRCVKELFIHDVVGVNFKGNKESMLESSEKWNFGNVIPQHFSGNFWWSKSSYVRQLKKPSSLVPNEEYIRYRWIAEMYICHLYTFNYKPLFNCNKNNYYEYYNIDEYCVNYELCVLLINDNQLDSLKTIVKNLLRQSNKDFHIHIIDQCSTQEGTDEYYDKLLRKYYDRINITYNKNKENMNDMYNTFFVNSKYGYLCFLDVDSKIGKSYIEDTIKVLNKEDDVAIVYHSTREDKRHNKKLDYDIIMRDKYQKNFTIKRNYYKMIPSGEKYIEKFIFHNIYYINLKSAVIWD